MKRLSKQPILAILLRQCAHMPSAVETHRVNDTLLKPWPSWPR